MIQLEVWGKYALFTRPELKVERVSYDVPTPSAARGIVESIYYHPGSVSYTHLDVYKRQPLERCEPVVDESRDRGKPG